MGNSNSENKIKFDFIQKKENVIRSLKEVDYFLRDFKHFYKYIKLYKLLK